MSRVKEIAYKVNLKVEPSWIYPVAMKGQYSYTKKDVLTNGDSVKAESFKECKVKGCNIKVCQRKLMVVNSKAYCFEHFVVDGFMEKKQIPEPECEPEAIYRMIRL